MLTTAPSVTDSSSASMPPPRHIDREPSQRAAEVPAAARAIVAILHLHLEEPPARASSGAVPPGRPGVGRSRTPWGDNSQGSVGTPPRRARARARSVRQSRPAAATRDTCWAARSTAAARARLLPQRRPTGQPPARPFRRHTCRSVQRNMRARRWRVESRGQDAADRVLGERIVKVLVQDSTCATCICDKCRGHRRL